ncbi:MAG: hypothetical protein RL557_131 [archaeon]|jgi:archaellum biogenesis protein FlaJ (TadC family)
MYFDALKNNLKEMKDIARELYVFYNQYETLTSSEKFRHIAADQNEKNLLKNVITSLSNQLKILNSALPALIQAISYYKKYPSKEGISKEANLAQVTYKPSEDRKVSLVISDDDKKEFLRNLSISRLSINQLKREYTAAQTMELRKPSMYAKLSNYFFRNFSESLVHKGHFNTLNRSLRKINSEFIVSTYVSMVFFTTLLGFIIGFFFFCLLLFVEISIVFPFFSITESSFLARFLKFFWLPITLPFITGGLFYLYPFSEAKNIGNKINQELPFLTIHMSAIASSGVNPISIFEIIVKSKEYRYTTLEFKKILNLINFHGEDMVTALRTVSSSCPSQKLGEMLNGLAFTIKSGGDLHRFLNKHAENMLFDYRLERERYIKVAETFMDIYISVAIAAPMIFLMIFIIIGSTGLTGGLFNLGVNALSLLLILGIIILNVVFLIILGLKQPAM